MSKDYNHDRPSIQLITSSLNQNCDYVKGKSTSGDLNDIIYLSFSHIQGSFRSDLMVPFCEIFISSIHHAYDMIPALKV
jgi:hypothetical protein